MKPAGKLIAEGRVHYSSLQSQASKYAISFQGEVPKLGRRETDSRMCVLPAKPRAKTVVTSVTAQFRFGLMLCRKGK
jgi:hypothetical protein